MYWPVSVREWKVGGRGDMGSPCHKWVSERNERDGCPWKPRRRGKMVMQKEIMMRLMTSSESPVQRRTSDTPRHALPHHFLGIGSHTKLALERHWYAYLQNYPLVDSCFEMTRGICVTATTHLLAQNICLGDLKYKPFLFFCTTKNAYGYIKEQWTCLGSLCFSSL